MNKRIECTVSGRVQMVMYRDFTARTARKFGLAGEVWNEKNGTVTVVAEGSGEMLDQLILALHHGSLLARVDDVVVRWMPATGAYNSFVIRYP